MRRLLAGVTLAATALLITPALTTAAHAQARRSADPMTALKRQLRAGHGVKFTQTTKLVSKADGLKGGIVGHASGVLQFDKSGIMASDIKTRSDRKKKDPLASPSTADAYFGPERTIWVRGTAYISGAGVDGGLDPGKVWYRKPKGPVGGVGLTFEQLVSPAEPAVLKDLLAHTSAKRRGGTVGGTKTTLYTGTTTFGRLYKVSPWFRVAFGKPRPTATKIKVAWKLYVGSDGLTRRVVTSYHPTKETSYVTDTRYSKWGMKVSIKAPHGYTVQDAQ
jgi:hypothetical protein